MTLRVLVVDDHPVFRHGLAATVEALAGVELAGVAASGEDAVAAVAADPPDVVLMDLNMPGMGGLAAIRAVRDLAPSVAVLVLTMAEDEQSLTAALRAGALGYVLKGADEEEIALAVAAVGTGTAVFGAGVAARVLAQLGDGSSRPAAGARPFPELTDREREVLVLVAQGLGNAAIARRLVLSQKTVRNHVSNIVAKLHAASRAEVIEKAERAGLTS